MGAGPILPLTSTDEEIAAIRLRGAEDAGSRHLISAI
jgi:hypothetical protein